MDQQLKNVALATLYLSVAGFFLILLLTIKEGAELFHEISKAESAQRIELMQTTQAQIEASESLLTSTTSFASGAFLLSEASDLRSAKSAVSIMDGSIQKARDSGMENVATSWKRSKVVFYKIWGSASSVENSRCSDNMTVSTYLKIMQLFNFQGVTCRYHWLVI